MAEICNFEGLLDLQYNLKRYTKSITLRKHSKKYTIWLFVFSKIIDCTKVPNYTKYWYHKCTMSSTLDINIKFIIFKKYWLLLVKNHIKTIYKHSSKYLDIVYYIVIATCPNFNYCDVKGRHPGLTDVCFRLPMIMKWALVTHSQRHCRYKFICLHHY